jgi:Skp family chaperone for outer membrane proteins
MCTTNLYTYIYPDGRKEHTRVPSLCSHSRHNIPCPNNVVFQHPPSYVSNAGEASSAPSGSPFMPMLGGHFPPTPTYTPRSSTPNNYRSGDESDRSGYRSGSSSRSKRSPTVYVNGQAYDLEPHGSPSSRHARKSSRGEHVVINGPPSPRTPPTSFPTSAPSSPSAPYIVDVNRRASSSSRNNPVVIDVVDPNEYRHSKKKHHSSEKKHSRHTSTSSHESTRRSHDEEEKAASRRRRRERKQQEQEEAERRDAQRSSRLLDRINQANANIANRPAVPMPPRRSSTYRDAELTEAVRNLNLDKERRREQRAKEAEEEALKQRLKERMLPRRNTISGGRRHQVLYDDGTYRWE